MSKCKVFRRRLSEPGVRSDSPIDVLIIGQRVMPREIRFLRRVNELAFGRRPAEADLVERLRQACTDSLSLVAEDDAVVGHILFTSVVVESMGRDVRGMGLAPMAVLPDRQRQGIGSQLVRRGLDTLRVRGCPFVVVVGHTEYYPRFGFETASTYSLASQPPTAAARRVSERPASDGPSIFSAL